MSFLLHYLKKLAGFLSFFKYATKKAIEEGAGFGCYPLPANAAAKIQPVKSIRATATTNSVTLSWKKEKGAKSYKVFQQKKGWSAWKKTTKAKYIKLKKNKNYKVKKAGKKFFFRKYGNVYKVVKKTKRNKITIAGLKKNTKYRFKIQAVAGKKVGKFSKVFSVRTKTVANNRNNGNNNSANNKTNRKSQDTSKSKSTTGNNSSSTGNNNPATYFYMRNHAPYEGEHYGTITTGTKDANGIVTMSVKFITDADSPWIKNNYNIVLEDVTPKSYKYIFSKLGCKSGFTSNIQYSKEGTKTIVTVNITANPAVQAIKIYEKSGKNIGFLGSNYNSAYYVFPSENDKSGNPYQYDVNLYKKFRQKIEAKLWNSQMSNYEKLKAVSDYINEVSHYPGNVTSRQYNPEYWEDWAVDDTTTSMGNKSILYDMMVFQGRCTTCTAASIIKDVAVQDLGIKYYDTYSEGTSATGERVYIGIGYDSSVKHEKTDHRTLYYVDSKGEKWGIDTQGLGIGWTSNLKCSEHHCKDHLISLD